MALMPHQVGCPLARAGHSVDVLLKRYAKCIDGAEATVNTRIEEALLGRHG
jgi:hypothetical protein